jgi:asparagine synthase (glutamine-hydrolysing)
MCGISGTMRRDGTPVTLPGSMREAIRFRGRDAEGAWSGPGATLVQARLAIIDIAGGDQPMTDPSGRYTIVYSGEVYNYRELRVQYERAGARFRTHSDTEVVLAGFALKGHAVCRELNGMFAFAVWDAQRRELTLARDHLGKKPLFWLDQGDTVYFASTLDAFADLPGWSGRLSTASLALYAMLGSVPGERTVYDQARSVPPATTITIAEDRPPRVDRYWRLDLGSRRASRTARDVDEAYEALLTDAVRLRLRSDVPVALTFSGGVDSGTIAALCARNLDTPLRCFTVDHHTPDDPSEETVNAQRAAGELGLPWEFISFDYHRDLLRELDAAYAWYDQPSQQMALVYSHRLYHAIRPHATVVLSGNGSDELFTGYRGDESVRRRDLLVGPLRPLRRLLAHTPAPAVLRLGVVDAYAVSLRAEVAEHAGDAGAADEASAAIDALAEDARASGVRTLLDLKLWADLTFATADANYRLPDISGLEAQVEVRSPFLDHRMVDFAARLPAHHKVARPLSGPVTKALPKRVYARMVSRDLAYARKKGMGANLRWDRSIAIDAGFARAFDEAFSALDEAGVGSSASRAAHDHYVAAVRGGGDGGPYAGRMMAGFMLGRWLRRPSQGRAATTAPCYGYVPSRTEEHDVD